MHLTNFSANNPAMVNGEELEPEQAVRLRNGDEIQIAMEGDEGRARIIRVECPVGTPTPKVSKTPRPQSHRLAFTSTKRIESPGFRHRLGPRLNPEP